MDSANPVAPRPPKFVVRKAAQAPEACEVTNVDSGAVSRAEVRKVLVKQRHLDQSTTPSGDQVWQESQTPRIWEVIGRPRETSGDLPVTRSYTTHNKTEGSGNLLPEPDVIVGQRPDAIADITVEQWNKSQGAIHNLGVQVESLRSLLTKDSGTTGPVTSPPSPGA